MNVYLKTNFHNITIMVSRMDHKPGCWKKTVKKVFSLKRSISLKDTSSPLPSSQTKESKSSITFTLTILLAVDKLVCISPITSLVNTTTFKLVTPLQYQ